MELYRNYLQRVGTATSGAFDFIMYTHRIPKFLYFERPTLSAPIFVISFALIRADGNAIGGGSG